MAESRSHAAARSPIRRLNVAGSGGIPANGVRLTIRLEKAENVPHEEGHHVAGSGRDRTDFRHAGTFVTDAAAFRPVAAAYAACDVVPARLTPDGVSDAERHRLADETIGGHECQRRRLESSTQDAARCVRGRATTGRHSSCARRIASSVQFQKLPLHNAGRAFLLSALPANGASRKVYCCCDGRPAV